MINWLQIGLAVGRTLGQVLLSMGMSLLTGRAIKKLVLWPFEKLVKKTKTSKDDEILEEAKKDLDVQ